LTHLTTIFLKIDLQAEGSKEAYLDGTMKGISPLRPSSSFRSFAPSLSWLVRRCFQLLRLNVIHWFED